MSVESEHTTLRPGVSVGAFGKHPVEADHLSGLGLSTALMRSFKLNVYDHGFEPQIAAWMRLEAEGKSIPWGHTYLYRLNDDILLARFWESSDSIGRANYPMIVCVHLRCHPMDWVLGPVLDRLMIAEAAIKDLKSAQELSEYIDQMQLELRKLSRSSRPVETADFVSTGFHRVIQSKRMQDTDATARVVCNAGDLVDATRHAALAPAARGGFSQMRVPACATTAAEALHVWHGFFAALIGIDTPVALICPNSVQVVDVILGQPPATVFFCFKAAESVYPPITRARTPLVDEDRQYSRNAIQTIAATLTNTSQAESGSEDVAQEVEVTSTDDGYSEIPLNPSTAMAPGFPEITANYPVRESADHASKRWPILVAVILVVSLLSVTAIWFFNRKPVAVDPNPQWQEQASQLVEELTQPDAPVRVLESEQARVAAIPGKGDLARKIGNAQEQLGPVIEAAKAALAGVAPWSAENPSGSTEARNAVDARMKVAQETGIDLVKGVNRDIAKGFESIQHGQTFKDAGLTRSWNEYLQTTIRASSGLPDEKLEKQLDRLVGTLQSVEQRRKVFAVLDARNWQRPEFARFDAHPTSPTLINIQKVIEDWCDEQRENDLENLSAELPDDFVSQLSSKCSRRAKLGGDIWDYWYRVSLALADPSRKRPKYDPVAEVKDLADKCELNAGELEVGLAAINRVESEPPENWKGVFSDTNSSPALVMAAWDRIKVVGATMLTDPAFLADLIKCADSPDNSRWPNFHEEVSKAANDVWLAKFRAAGDDKSKIDELVQEKNKYLVPDHISSLDLDDGNREALKYDLAAYDYNQHRSVETRNEFEHHRLEGDLLNDPKVVAWLKVIHPIVQPIDPRSLPFSDGLFKKDETLEAGFVAFEDVKDPTHVLRFVKIDGSDVSRDVYICTTPFTVADLKTVIAYESIRKEFAGLPRGFGLRGWTYLTEPPTINCSKPWCSSDLSPKVGDLWYRQHPRGISPPSWRSPVTDIGPILCSQIASDLKCRLPTVWEWKTAFRAAGSKSEIMTSEDAGFDDAISEISGGGAWKGQKILSLWGSFAADAQLPADRSKDDRAIWFHDVTASGNTFDFSKNVAQWVVADPPKSTLYRIIGLSALCMEGSLLGDKKLIRDEPVVAPAGGKTTFGDVGFRLAFDVPTGAFAPVSHEEVTPIAPYVGLK